MVVLLLGLWAGPAWAAVAFDAASASGTGTTERSWTHTPSGTPKAVMVGCSQGDTSGADQVTGVTYGALTLTEVTGSPHLKATGEVMATYMYFAGASIPTGAQTVTVTVSGAASKKCWSITLTANTDTEIVSVNTSINTDTAQNPSSTQTLSGRTSFVGMVFTSGESAAGNITELSGWTNAVSEADHGNATGGMYYYNTVAAVDVTIGWTNATSVAALAIGLAISEVQAVTNTGGMLRGFFK